jgi:hypothetical protein
MQGVGKSAIAQVLCQELVANQQWSVYTRVDTRGASTPDEVAGALCRALCVPWYPVALPPAQRLLQHLQRVGPLLRQGLLVEDVDRSCSGTTSQAVFNLLSQLLKLAPGVQIILTSLSFSSAQQAALQQVVCAHALPTEPSQPSIAVQEVQPLSDTASCALLALHAGVTSLSADEASTITHACHHLPSLLRMAGCALQQGALELGTLTSICKEATQVTTTASASISQQGVTSSASSDTTALQQAGHPARCSRLLMQLTVRHLLSLLSPEQRAALHMICLLQVGVAQHGITGYKAQPRHQHFS